MDVESVVKLSEPGSAIFGRFALRQDGLMETGLFIRDDLHKIENIPLMPNIYFKAVMFDEQYVMPVAVLIKVDGIELPYDIWLNFHIDAIKIYFSDIILQKYVLVHFYSENKRERTVKVGNSLKEPFDKFRNIIMEHKPWGESQFVSAFRKVSNKYSTTENLWTSLMIPKNKQKYSNN